MGSECGDARMCNGSKPPAVTVIVGSKEVGIKGEEEEYAETKPLLPPLRKGGMAGRQPRNLKRKVNWNDHNGSKLAEVLEFQPSDSSDSEDEDRNACICVIM